MRQLFDDRDLRELDVRFSYHDLREQAQLLAEGKLDVATFVMQENAELLRTLIRDSLDIVAPQDFQDRYQQSMIDEAITTLATLFQRAPSAAKTPAGSVAGLNPSKFDPDGSGKLHATDGRIGCEIQVPMRKRKAPVRSKAAPSKPPKKPTEKKSRRERKPTDLKSKSWHEKAAKSVAITIDRRR